MKSKKTFRKTRHERIRKKLKGSGEMPRLVIFRSSNHIYAQIIDDEKHITIAQASSLKTKKEKLKNIEIAQKVGENLAKDALSLKIKKIIFDRAGYKYHGRIKALADSARKGGLVF